MAIRGSYNTPPPQYLWLRCLFDDGMSSAMKSRGGGKTPAAEKMLNLLFKKCNFSSVFALLRMGVGGAFSPLGFDTVPIVLLCFLYRPDNTFKRPQLRFSFRGLQSLSRKDTTVFVNQIVYLQPFQKQYVVCYQMRKNTSNR